MTTSSNSGPIQPAQGGEVACCSIAGGPFAAIDAYVSGGAAGVQLELRLYATVGTLRTRIASAQYAGPPVGGAGLGSLLEWVVVGDPDTTNPVAAGGTQYDLVVFGVSGAGTPIAATLAGTNAYDAAVSASATVALPSNYGSTTIVTNVGCAQLGDVGVDQTGLPQNVAFDIIASCGAGSVEARVATGATGGTDGFAAVIRDAKLPVATQYRAAVRETSGGRLSGTVKASLATYTDVIVGAIVVPPSAITPGPQITSLRSVIPTSPTTVVWASTGYIDFVADCGADPTGAADAGPAFERAMNFILALAANPVLPESTLTLYVPPGIYQFNDPTTVDRTYNFTGKGTAVRIRGEGDASIFYFNLQSGPSFLAQIANCQTIEIDHLCFIGSAPITGVAPVTADVGQIFILAPSRHTHVHHCSILGLVAQDSAIEVVNGDAEYSEIDALASKTIDAKTGILSVNGRAGSNGAHVHDCTCIDLGRVNGAPIPSGTIDGYSWIYIQGPLDYVLIEATLVDEHVKAGIYLDGAGGKTIRSVELRGMIGNGAVAPGVLGTIVATGVQGFVLDGFASHTAPLNTYFVFTSVDDITLRNVSVGPGGIGVVQVATADAACGVLRVINPSADAQGWTVANLTSAAKRTYWEQGGILSSVVLAGAAVSAGSILKLDPVGPTKIATTDGTGFAAYVSLDVSAGGTNVRAAHRTQVVQMISDGSGAIGIGDPVTNLAAAAAGEVKKAVTSGGTPIVGVAVSPAGAGPAVLFDVLFQLGQV